MNHFDTLFPVPPQWLETTLEEHEDEMPKQKLEESEILGFI